MKKLSDDFLISAKKGCDRSSPLTIERAPFALRRSGMWVVLATIIAIVMAGCGTPHATLQISAPSDVAANTPFTVSVTVIYNGNRDTVMNSQIHFSSSDPKAVLPTDYVFTAGNAGSMKWPNGFILKSPGSQTISADIYNAIGINGSVKILVTP